MPEFDVAIIGAGPAGSATAITLAGLGHKVLMLDRARFPRHKLCGDFLNPSNWPVLEALGVADAVRECRHARVSRVRIGARSGATAGGGLPLRNRLCAGLGIRRYFLDNVLVSRAKLLGSRSPRPVTFSASAEEKPGGRSITAVPPAMKRARRGSWLERTGATPGLRAS